MGSSDTTPRSTIDAHASSSLGPTDDEDGARTAWGQTASPDDPRFETADDPRIPPDVRTFKMADAARIVGVEPYVLRYWEREFSWVRPEKTAAGQRRYRRRDLAVLLTIRRLRYESRLSVAETRDAVQAARRAGRRAQPTAPDALIERARQLVHDLLAAAQD